MADLSAASNQINLAAVKRVDPYARDILEKASQVALYSFNGERNEWKKTEVEGALFVYSRTGEPFHNILIMNRLSTQNLMEPVVQGLDIQRQEPFLLYRNTKCDINGIWFYDKDECVRIAGVLDRLVREAPLVNSLPPAAPASAPVHNNNNNNGNDIFSMLSKAQEDYFSKTVSSPNNAAGPQPAETPRNVLDFFAMASSSKPVVAQSPALFIAQAQQAAQRVQLVQPPEVQDPNLRPILQRLKSNPVHSVEHIEKQQRSVTPQQVEAQPIEPKSVQKEQKRSGFKLKPAKENGKKAQSGAGVNSVNNSVSNVTNGINFLGISPTNVGTPMQQGVMASPRTPGSTGPMMDSRPDVTPKPALMPPVMFTSSPAHDATPQLTPQGHPAHLTNMANPVSRSPPLKPEPLTKNQLLQAFHYLLKNDPDFVNTLHEAYVKSFSEIVP